MACSYLASILIIDMVDDIMAAIFYHPVISIGLQDLFRRGLFGRLAGQAKSKLSAFFACSFLNDMPFNHKYLTDIREVDIVV